MGVRNQRMREFELFSLVIHGSCSGDFYWRIGKRSEEICLSPTYLSPSFLELFSRVETRMSSPWRVVREPRPLVVEVDSKRDLILTGNES